MYLTPSPVAISEAVAVCLQRKVCEGGWVVFYYYLYTERYGYILFLLLTAPKVWILSLISAFKRSIGSNFEFIHLHTICDTIYYTSTIVKRSTFYEWEYYYYLATHGKEWRIHWPVKPWRCSLLKDDFLFFWPYTHETRSFWLSGGWLAEDRPPLLPNMTIIRTKTRNDWHTRNSISWLNSNKERTDRH